MKKALVGIRDRFHIEVDDGDDLKAHGNIVDHEYEIERDGDKIAEISKKWFRVRDTYGVEVFDDADPRAAPARSPSPSTPSPTTSSDSRRRGPAHQGDGYTSGGSGVWRGSTCSGSVTDQVALRSCANGEHHPHHARARP